MARAKRTSRAAARRRSRAEALANPDGSATAPRSSTPSSRSETERPGMMDAFRIAYRPPQLREDIRLLPSLLISRAFLISGGLVVLAGVLLLTPLVQDTMVALFVGAMVYVPPAFAPPLIAPFIAGFLATRASYLIGFLVGILVVAMFAVYVFVTPSQGTDAAERALYVLQAATLEVPMAVLFASFAAYYKRLLRVWNPQRGGGGQGRPAKSGR